MDESPVSLSNEKRDANETRARQTFRLSDLFVATALVAVLCATGVATGIVFIPLWIGTTGTFIYLGRAFDWRVVRRGGIGGGWAGASLFVVDWLLSSERWWWSDVAALASVSIVLAFYGCVFGLEVWIISYAVRRVPFVRCDERRVRVWSTAIGVFGACGLMIAVEVAIRAT